MSSKEQAISQTEIPSQSPVLFSWDADASLWWGPNSYLTIFKQILDHDWSTSPPQADINPYDNQDHLPCSPQEFAVHSAAKSFTVSAHRFRPLYPQAYQSILGLESLQAELGLSIDQALITGRNNKVLGPTTLHQLQRTGLMDHFQENVFLKQNGWSSSQWKYLVLKHMVTNGYQRAFHFDNDPVTVFQMALWAKQENLPLQFFLHAGRQESSAFTLKLLGISQSQLQEIGIKICHLEEIPQLTEVCLK
jgi:hypothetical protein